MTESVLETDRPHSREFWKTTWTDEQGSGPIDPRPDLSNVMRICSELRDAWPELREGPVEPVSYAVTDETNLPQPRTQSLGLLDESRIGFSRETSFGVMRTAFNVLIRQERQRIATETVRRTYHLRIMELRAYGLEDEIELNRASEEDFFQFTSSTSLTSEAALFLLDNGNLRAVWKNDSGGHVGIQFLGRQQVECVIFQSRDGGDFVSRMAGHDTLSGVKRQILAFDLDALVGV